VLLVAERAVEGWSQGGEFAPIGRLWRRLTSLVSPWEELGRSEASDHELLFVPKQNAGAPQVSPRREWIIERTSLWEVDRLA
jgi:hypothetical protein